MLKLPKSIGYFALGLAVIAILAASARKLYQLNSEAIDLVYGSKWGNVTVSGALGLNECIKGENEPSNPFLANTRDGLVARINGIDYATLGTQDRNIWYPDIDNNSEIAGQPVETKPLEEVSEIISASQYGPH